MDQTFNKKIFTPKMMLKDIGVLIANFPKIFRMMRNQKMSHAFMEKIMTITTAVNGCVYCEWFHAKQALKAGIGEEELQNLLNLQFTTETKPDEITALLYAQHYAETNRQPDSEMNEQLQRAYGPEKAEQIRLVIQMINFGNRYGNTWEAGLNRLKGTSAQQGRPVFEILFFIFNFPFLYPVLRQIQRGA